MSDDTRTPTPPPEHEHVWKFLYDSYDWWDGDGEDVYECTVPGCNARDRRYVPR